MSSIINLVATHKTYSFPQDAGYFPIHVGKKLANESLNIPGDDLGENISSKNKNYCELTALYWIWKNNTSDSKAIGLSHYRRYFKPSSKFVFLKDRKIASTQELSDLLKTYEVILAKPRNYWIESIESHYANAHHKEDLEVLRHVLLSKYPEYQRSYDSVMKGTKLSLFNMFVMKREHFESYCQWLFDILFEVEKIIPYYNYGPYQGRVFGFLGERLLNVWVKHNFNPGKIKYLPVVNIEGENLIKKGIGMLKRKITGEKPL